MAPRTPHGVSTFFDPSMLAVQQQLPFHMRTARSQVGPNQRRPEEGRITLRVHPALLQQEKRHSGG
jgi:hypothetical protein